MAAGSGYGKLADTQPFYLSTLPLMLTPTRTFLLIILSVFALYTSAQDARPSTAADNVQLVTLSDFHNQPRMLRIYLPPYYADSQKHYPVLYMHDGQNLFDDATSFVGEWGVDEVLNHLADKQGLEVIVVGIDHGNALRARELSAWSHPKYGEALGQAYGDFVVNQVKPYVDERFRTLTGRAHTAVAGSSMGGLMSHYLVHRYPEVFSRALIFSPSYWYSDKVMPFTRAHPAPLDTRLFMLVGEQEGESMAADTRAMYQLLGQQGPRAGNLTLLVDKQGQHNEAFWRRHLAGALSWLWTDKVANSPSSLMADDG